MKYYGYRKREKLEFSYHLVEHCNLNCKGCDNYSPIAPKQFTDINIFERDIKRLRELFDNRIVSIGLLGGEPLLNPNICDFFDITRRYFPEKEICVYIITNGLLLNKMPEYFWDKCRCCNIEVRYTKYPINIDYNQIAEIANAKQVILSEFGHKDVREKSLEFLPFDLEGRQNIEENFKKCFHANRCIQISDGCIYTCNIRAYINHFTNKYGIQMETSERDRINIHDSYTSDQILEFLSKPIPFCRFCNIKGRSDGHIWRKANKNPEIFDWLNLNPKYIGKDFLSSYDKLFFLIDNDFKLEHEAVSSMLDKEINAKVLIGDVVVMTKNIINESSEKNNIVVVYCCNTDDYILSERLLVENGVNRVYRIDNFEGAFL